MHWPHIAQAISGSWSRTAGPITVSKPRPIRTDSLHPLDLVADIHAAAAQDALVGIPDDGEYALVSTGYSFLSPWKRTAADVVLVGQGPQLAVLVARAGGTLERVVREQQLQVHPARGADRWRVGLDHQPLGSRDRRMLPAAFWTLSPPQADPADRPHGQVRVVAQSRNADACLSGRLQHCAPCLGLDLAAVDRHR